MDYHYTRIFMDMKSSSLVFFLFFDSKLALSVGNSNVQFGSSLNDGGSLSGRQVVSEFSAIGSVIHQQQFEVSFVSDDEGLEATLSHESSGLISSVTNSDHGLVASESSSDSIIDTSGSSPAGAQFTRVIFVFESGKSGGLLVNDSLMSQRSDGHFLSLCSDN